MGIARLLAKAWVVFCVFAAAQAGAQALAGGATAKSALASSLLPGLLFCAMGLLFVAGYGASRGHLASRVTLASLTPGFNGLVMSAFLLAVFVLQSAAPSVPRLLGSALQAAMRFAVPGQRALEEALTRCNLDGTRALAGAAAWFLAFVFLATAVSHWRIGAAVVRLEAKRHPGDLGPSAVSLVLGLVAVAGIQLLFVGSLFHVLPCGALASPLGGVLTGAAPLMLSYLAAAALMNLFAAAPDA